MKILNKIFFIIILSFSIFGCLFFEEDITSPNNSKSADKINAELNGYKIKIFGETFTFSGDILSKNIEIKGNGEKYITASAARYELKDKIRYFFHNQRLNLTDMTVDNNGADADNSNAILIKLKVVPQKYYSWHPSLQNLEGEEITFKLTPNKTWAKPIVFDDIQNALNKIEYKDEKGSKIEFNKINLKYRLEDNGGRLIWLTNVGTEVTTNEMEKALKDSLNKKPLVDTEKFTLEPIDEDLTYWGGDIKMFFKDIELLPKEGYGIDVSKLEGIHLSNLSLPLIILGNDMIGDTYSIVEESYRLKFNFYISPFKSK